MAELSRTFQAGRMNKDFDERLVPQGEYRDALNLDLSSSEGSDIGALQMLKGNVEYKNKSYNASTETYTVWPDNEYISSYTNAFCIGSIADNTNDKVYWLVGSDDYNCIAEYDVATKVTSPVLVEDKAVSNFLNFSLDYLVTGINILEGYLIWTDDQTEPKQIEIQKFKDGTSTFVTHTTFESVQMVERHTTVAKIGPINAPTLAMYNTSRNAPTDSSFTKNFALNPLETGEIAPSIPANQGVNSQFTITLSSLAEFYSGDIIYANTVFGDTTTNLSNEYTAILRCVTDYDTSGFEYTFEFLGFLNAGLNNGFVIDETVVWDLDLQGEKSIFELKFATFAYRFVYKNNQVSPFSPFSKPAFLPQEYDFESHSGYNKGMINDLKKLMVFYGLDINDEVESVDLLFKETHNTTVYTIKNIKVDELGDTYVRANISFADDATGSIVVAVNNASGSTDLITLLPGQSTEVFGTNYVVSVPPDPSDVTVVSENIGYGFPITSEITRGAVEPNQLLRPWDNVPKKAKAQEIIGNRIVYANYTQNYTLEGDIEFDTSKTLFNSSEIPSLGQPYETIKSLRTYQLGVVFKDKYGRETPVFSNETGVISTDLNYSDLRTNISAGMLGQSPKNPDGTEMFEYFKFFVKEPSQEYYNAVADKLYLSPDGFSCWISFPSSEVNKFQVGDHIILKKGHGEDLAVKSKNNRYKVLAIESEPPEDIAFRYNVKGSAAQEFSISFPVLEGALQLVYGNTPVPGSNAFTVIASDADVRDNLVLNNYVRFQKEGVFSSRYKITRVDTAGNNCRRVFVDGVFGTDVNFIYSQPGEDDSDVLYPVSLEVTEREKIETYEEFKGRFFARLEVNEILTSSFSSSNILVDGQAWTFNNQPAFWYNGYLDGSGRHFSTGGFDQSTGGNADAAGGSYNAGWYVIGGGMPYDTSANYNSRPWIFGGLNYGSSSQAYRIFGSGGPGFGALVFSDIETVTDWSGPQGSSYRTGFPTETDVSQDGQVSNDDKYYNGDPNTPYDVVIAKRHDASQNNHVGGDSGAAGEIGAVKVGSRIRFSNHEEIYTVVHRRRWDRHNTKCVSLYFDKRIQQPVNPYAIYNIVNLEARYAADPVGLPNLSTGYASELNANGAYEVDGIEYGPIDRTTDPDNPTGLVAIELIVQEAVVQDNRSSFDPAIFETEPEESLDLNLYYEASNAIPISEYNDQHVLPWFNAYGFGNGVESNRIRDDYNAFQLGKGAKVSTVLDDPYQEENRSNGFIFSQIFNSTAGVNRLNQFIQALPITKDLNPIYGSIQKLHTRDTDLITLCEDKCFRVLANKDALFNADGNTNITGNTAVLGQAIPYIGEFGISTNPESFAFYGFRAYFADKSRGAVIRLSRDGITEISNKGMGDFFADNLKENANIIGSYNQDSNLYNITLSSLTDEWQEKLAEGTVDRKDCDDDLDIGDPKTTETTVSFSEATKGWESRKSFIPESGLSINNGYYTFKDGLLWLHGENETHNNFYGEQSFSTVTAIFNDVPAVVKGFKTIDYVGSRPRNYVYTTGNGVNYSIAEINAKNLTPTGQSVPANKEGWYAQAIVTDMQEGQIKEFISKENKNFNYIKGIDTFFNSTCDTNVSTSEFSVQGIGRATSITGDVQIQQYKVRIFADINCYVP